MMAKQGFSYLIGIVLLGLAYPSLKVFVENDFLVFGIVLVYVIALRLVAERFGEK
jgi:hypothetical protein